MLRLDLDLIRHALLTAEDRGYSEVEIAAGDDIFQATFLPRRVEKKSRTQAEKQDASDALTKTISAPSVGYYRPPKGGLEVGKQVAVGDVVGEIVALGLKNEVPSKWAGKIVQVIVTPEQPVEFGQPLVLLGMEA
jgi:biotin carboxyl carrier protein